ncbi:MAG: hypothetical protein ACO3S0_12055 [bacterium]
MRGAPKDSETLFSMIDGIFAVAITLSLTVLPESLRQRTSPYLILETASLLLIALTMLLLWLKLRTIVQLKEKLNYTDVAFIALILMVAVMIPKSGYLAIRWGHLEGNLWNWSHSQSVNAEYQGLLLLVEGVLLILSWRTMQSPRARCYPRSLRHWILGLEGIGMILLAALVVVDNLIPNINGVYIYAVPLILLSEEGLCLIRMKAFEQSRNRSATITDTALNETISSVRHHD